MALWEAVWPVLAALLPSAGLLFLFWVLMKHILEGDRRERAAQRAWEAERTRLRNTAGQRPRDHQPPPSGEQ